MSANRSTPNANSEQVQQVVNRLPPFRHLFNAGCLALVLTPVICVALAWVGWQWLPSGKSNQPITPAVIDSRKVGDPLDCAAQGMWVVSWQESGQRRYACTPKW